MLRERATRELLASAVRRDIVDLLSALPAMPGDGLRARRDGMTAAELAVRLGLHVTTIRFHLDQLVSAGLVEARDVRLGVGRPRRHFSLDPLADQPARHSDDLVVLAEVLSDAMADQAAEGVLLTPEEAAVRWVRRRAATSPPTAALLAVQSSGSFLARVGVMVDMLERWGYLPAVRPAPDGRSAEIELPSHPLADIARRNPGVALGLHLGLLRGTLEILGEPEALVEVEKHPEVGPWLVRLTTGRTREAEDGVEARQPTAS
jgi:predicted ArsR family transcriptional regulator